MENKQNKSFISHFLAIGTGTIISMALGLLTTPIITRIVDPNEYGQLSIFQMYTNIALMVLCLGLDQSLVRFYYDHEEIEYKQSLLRYCFWMPMLISCIVAVIVSTLAVTHLVTFEFSPHIMVLLGINVVITVANRIAVLVLRINYQSKLFSLCNILTKIAYITVALVLIFTIQNHYFTILAIATIVSYFVPTVFAIFSSRNLWKLKTNYVMENKSEILRYGLPLILSMGITTVFQALDKITLNAYCTYSEVGVYSSAMTLVNIFAIIQTTFNSLWGPMQVEHYVKYPEDTAYIQKANRMITVIMFGIGISLILVKDIFSLLLGEKFREAAYIMPFLIFNPIMYTISETTCAGIGISKKSYLNIIVAVGACLTNLAGNLLLVPVLEGKGAAISTGISYIVFWALRMIISNRYYYVDYGNAKFIFFTILIAGYALYNTFYIFNWVSISMFVVLMVFLLFLYRSSLTDIWAVVMRFIGQKVKK